jgi:hypothetical protein
LLLLSTVLLIRLRELGRLTAPHSEAFESEETASFLWLIERSRGTLFQFGLCLGNFLSSLVALIRAQFPKSAESSRQRFNAHELERIRVASYREGFRVGLSFKLCVAIALSALVELAVMTVAFILYANNDIIQKLNNPAISELHIKFAGTFTVMNLTSFLTNKFGVWSGALTLVFLGLEKYLDNDFRLDWKVQKFSEYEWLQWTKSASPREILLAETSRFRPYGGHITLIAFDVIVPAIAACVLPLGFVLLLCLPPLIATFFKNIVVAKDSLRVYRIIGYWLAVICIMVVWLRKAFV